MMRVITPLELLQETRQVLSDEERWIKHKDHVLTPAGLSRFCATGALIWQAQQYWHPKPADDGRFYNPVAMHKCDVRAGNAYSAALGYLREAVGGRAMNVTTYNDLKETKHADILALYDRAIGNAKLDAGLWNEH